MACEDFTAPSNCSFLGNFLGGVSCGIATADMTSMASRGVSLVEVDSRLLDII